MSEYKVTNPATGKVEASYPTANEQDIQQAITKADDAYKEWRNISLSERSALLHKIADIYIERQDELANMIAVEMGKPVAQGKGELALVAEIYRYYADNAEQLLAHNQINVAEGSAFVEKLPVGALLGIMPWNYPHYQVARFAAPNFMAGNTIILKHAPQCPKTAEVIVEILKDAGLPDGVYNNVFATNDQAATIIEDSRIQGISLTGSERAGQAVAKIAGGALKKVVLELGGSDAFIVAADADIEQAVADAITGRFGNTGQACNAAKRLIVVEAVYDKFVQGFADAVREMTLSDPLDQTTFIGPMSSKSAAVNLQKQLDEAIKAGATVLIEGGIVKDKPGAWFAPAVLTNVDNSMAVYSEELFGPVAVIYKARDIADAIKIANDVPFGLGASIQTKDSELAAEIADQLEVGMVTINAPSGTEANTPFGGVKRSGFGRELGTLGITEFLNYKLIRNKTSA
ncbi:succinate-semialdehyde dehydrogenase / glutarate-semialdehyde dehydrogenase [Pseudoalteromonas nigrifaciens]|uniref:6-oxohexanoate dehydrogenase, succinate-semialdehyde dehydrogenase [NADP+] n=5 Tax=Gammaproteobacteria TaxID=1236 RepID=Q3IGS0_PSET1|nr:MULTISPECIES: NAD-dependent succinate-semialdehyde dehydrogenase [Pseudoalteromonas]ASM54151.1 succinate-semialdehyde dehydrogenase / glutarate-semialdehyde dehydrogenase [Pseudoalteromonas nigrifaciens]MBB1404815.1 NAD-dependent succinate-semialdehyde dehydrogenase [Pseudoalteromonas sp. SG44-5]MBH0071276.1 NAD-dependent succinate-semialdehyde dehydrogenase [Pseudoalteromonas sp. NZS127]NYR11742.1 NAD-dependent succinate-semialdehyde dehydrogenase [Pseudoalteromonas sp. MIP2626]CAI86663.1 